MFAETLLGVSQSGILFEVIVHLGTLASILVIFRDDIKKLLKNWSSTESRMLFLHLGIGTIPVVFAGLIFRSQIEIAFQNLRLVGFAFLVTGTVLILTSFATSVSSQINKKKSIVIGLSQAFALIPGISRSGMTIATGLILRMDTKEAARFSFLLAIPSLLGSGIFMIKDLLSLGSDLESMGVFAAGFMTSFVVGVIALKFLLSVLVKGKFHWFGVYCLVLGIISIGI